jgi:hypothetical protein
LRRNRVHVLFKMPAFFGREPIHFALYAARQPLAVIHKVLEPD